MADEHTHTDVLDETTEDQQLPIKFTSLEDEGAKDMMERLLDGLRKLPEEELPE